MDNKIFWATHATPWGNMFIAWHAEGICHAMFYKKDYADIYKRVVSAHRNFSIIEDQSQAEQVVCNIITAYAGNSLNNLLLTIHGTEFQKKVWQALTSISYGSTCSYEDIARLINHPRAIRAAAHAIGQNPLALVIPCHRVLRKNGDIGGYRWGVDKKKALITLEKNVYRPTNV